MSQPGYYDGSYPPSVLHPAPAATGATAGIPGSWTPAGSTPPASPASMSGITASPTSAWTSGQFVQTGTAGAAGRVTWTGTGWVGGAAPLQAPAQVTKVAPAEPDPPAEPVEGEGE